MNNGVIKTALIITLLSILPINTFASSDSTVTYEVESLFPMYFFGGYHFAAGVRYKDYRFRASCIDGGDYDYEPNDKTFERNLDKGCGLFAGYFLDANWHIYTFVEDQSYIVTKRNSGIKDKFDVIDLGGGVGYQYFLTKSIYIQPAVHLYWRKSQTKTIDGTDYTLRQVDVSPVVRVGYRF